MKSNKRAFSFVEIIITLSIIVLLAVIWLNANNNYQERTVNAKIVSDIETINNALTQYANENNSLPIPGGNNNFFKADASYAHSYDDNETFWVHGFITENTIPKKYLQVVPIDPATNQYYAYGKTKEENNTITNYSKVANQFEIAWVFKENNTSRAFVRGNYTAKVWPFNLIREYNGPNFVFDEGMYLPYNGDERLLTAKIWDYSGNVTINGNTENISSTELVAWDEIVVPAWETADIYFSDGSKSILWDVSEESRLILSQLDFVQEDNLATKVKLVLWGGTLWNKASHLDQDSGFEIYTTDSTAAVRWTIFWVNKTVSNTNITVQKWKIEIAKVTSATDTDALTNQVKDDSVEKNLIPNTNGTDADSTIESDGASVWITIEGSTGDTSSDTNAADTIIERVENEVIHEIGTISNTIIPAIQSFTSNGIGFEVSLTLNDTFQNADFLKIEYNEDDITASLLNIFTKANAGETQVAFLENTWKESDNLILTQDTVFIKNDGSEIRLGALKQVVIFFWNRLWDGTIIETRGQALTLDGSISYERWDDGLIAGIIEEDSTTPEQPEQNAPDPTDPEPNPPVSDPLPPTTDPAPTDDEGSDDETIIEPASCGYGIAHEGGKYFYKSPSVPFGTTCDKQYRVCNDGSFDGDDSYYHETCNVEELVCWENQDKIGNICVDNNLGSGYQAVQYHLSGDLNLAGLNLGSNFAVEFTTNGISGNANEKIYIKEWNSKVLYSVSNKIKLVDGSKFIATSNRETQNKKITVKFSWTNWNIKWFDIFANPYYETPTSIDWNQVSISNAKNITIYRKK